MHVRACHSVERRSGSPLRSPSAFPLCHSRCIPPSVELEEVVGKAYELSLAPDIVEASQEELSEAACFLDLTEDRLNRLLSLCVCLPCFHSPEKPLHPLLEGEVLRNPAAGSGWFRIGVSRISWRYRGLDALALCMSDILFAEVACVGAQFSRCTLAVLLYLIEHRYKLLLVV